MFTPGLIILALLIIFIAACIMPWWYLPLIILGAIFTLCLKKH